MSDLDEALLIYQLKSRQISRREFVKRGLMLGLSLGAVQSLLAACAPQPTPTESPAPTGVPATATPTTAPAATATPIPTGPTRGGTLIILTSDPPINHSPIQAKTIGDQSMFNLCYDYLVLLDNHYELKPMLAESWEPLEGGKVWQFNLRRGVKFHHGTEFTADDVVFTWDLIQDPDYGCPVRSAFEDLEGVEKVDDYTVLFHWKHVFVDGPAWPTFYQCAIVPHDKPRDYDHQKESVGTGPFKLSEFITGEYHLVVRNEDYWGAAEGFPYLDAVKVVYLAEDEGKLAAVQSGQGHVMWNIKPDLIPVALADPNLLVSTVETGTYQPLKMRVDMPPFDDNRVRLAMKYVVDREVMGRATVGDYGSLGNDHPVAPCFPLHVEQPLRQRDIEKAKALLAEAGYPDGIDVELNAPAGRPPIVEQALAFQEMAKAAGIRVNIITKAWEIFVANAEDQNTQVCLTNWTSRAVPGQTLTAHWRCGAVWNQAYWCDDEFERLMDESDAEVDFEKRKALYGQIQQVYSDRGPCVIAYFKNEQAALRTSVKNYEAHPKNQFTMLTGVWLSEA